MKISSYDIIGSKDKGVAIIEEVVNPEEVAKQIMGEHKNVKTVLMKLSGRFGVERKRKYNFIVGEADTEVIHRENYCRFKLDPEKVYFSGRESTERLRISEMVNPGETILVMFAGIGPFSILIAKKRPDIDKIPSIEINRDAVEYMKENVRLNKVQDKVIPILGDVQEESQEWFMKCDRIIMPLPHDAREYLDLAYKCLKPKGGIIHVYIIEPENDVEKNIENLMKKFQGKIGEEITYKIRRVLPYSPRTYKYCIDIQVKAGVNLNKAETQPTE